MNASAIPLLGVFEKKMRLEVPLFQRQYVWDRERQWEPLWDDIQRKFSEYLEGRKDAPVHFLGAMVLDQKQTPTTHVEKRQVIDGQQRLTTLQILLAALRDFCRDNECPDLADECDSFILNRGLMAQPEVDRFKVWPTQADRPQFVDVVASSSRAAVEQKYPLVKRKYARSYDSRPRMVEAYLFFYDRIREFFGAGDADGVEGETRTCHDSIEECLQALKSALHVVVIDLDQGDDAQVIFETLNARGEPLLPADLLRNYIFLRATRLDEKPDELYQRYWREFDDAYWRQEVRQGRLSRPRSDLFMQHFLASRMGRDVPIRHLFVEYKFWINRTNPFRSVEHELQTLARQGTQFRRFLTPDRNDVLFQLLTFLEQFDISTVYPLLLLLADGNPSHEEWEDIARTIESYLLRRAVCGLSTKNYTRVFLAIARAVQRDGATAFVIRRQLTDSQGEGAEWPTDNSFASAWSNADLYRTLRSDRLSFVLGRLNEASFNRRMEQIAVQSELTVEHLLPQNWIQSWPLRDGLPGMSETELAAAPMDAPRATATRARNQALHTLGNLTLVTRPLNSLVSNGPWRAKRQQILSTSLLPLNAQLHEFEEWDEAAIQKRGTALFNHALRIWPGP